MNLALGTALAAAVLAPAAEAAGPNWDTLAQCESGGRWNINTGNGYYGGIQFSASTWRAYGGTQYAARADLATKAQQIVVGQRVLAGQGPGAWPACSRSTGWHNGQQATRSGVVGSKPTAKPVPRPNPARVNPRPAVTQPGVAGDYVVKPGDTLSGIARGKHVAGGWPALYERNRGRVVNPHLIYPGQALDLS